MAIGDAVAAFLGTAATNRQPSSGVEEQISSILKPGTDVNDQPKLYDGTNELAFLAGTDPTTAAANTMRNMAIMITNSIYIRKPGTAERVYFGGVQTNA